MTDFDRLRKEKELIKLRESARYSWREELSEKTDHPYVDVMPNEKTGEEKKSKKKEKEEVKEEALEEGAFKDQYGKKGKLSQSSERKSLGRGSSIKDGAKPTGYESKSEFRDAAKKFSLKPNTKFRTEEKEKPTAMDLVKKSLPKGVLIDTKNQPKRQHWSKEHARKDYDPGRYDKKND